MLDSFLHTAVWMWSEFLIKKTSKNDKYSQIYVPHKNKKIIEQFSNNHNICIMRKDQGRGVVIIGKSKYTAKCLELLQTNQFSKLKHFRPNRLRIKSNVHLENWKQDCQHSNIIRCIQQLHSRKNLWYRKIT